MEWRWIPGFEGTYEVSENGDFRCVLNDGSTRPKATHADRAGYRRASLYKNSRPTTVYVMRAVAGAFIGERPEGHEVCHKDGDNSNNHFSNLKYDTVLNNRRDKVQHGTTRNQNTKTHCKNGHAWTKATTKPFGSRGQRVCGCGSL